jgi:phosphoglycerate dehydrogenase-like enzyme
MSLRFVPMAANFNSTVQQPVGCIRLGAGGIGQEVAKLCAAAGMRVIGPRRRVSSGSALPPGFARLESSDLLHDLLRESEFVAVCCPWTKETNHLIGRAAFATMKRGTVLVNIARGEIIDEEALLQALAEGRLRGAWSAAASIRWPRRSSRAPAPTPSGAPCLP